MALRLNLYHEVLTAKKLKRRDPLKLAIYGLSALAAGFAVYYFVELGRMKFINDELAKVQAEFNAIEPQAKAAKKREEELSVELKKSALISKRMENRFYWAPLLEQVSQVVPREVQITRLSGDISGEGLRKCSFTIDGISAGSDPRKVAEELRIAIADKLGPKYKAVTSNFKSLEDGTEMVSLDGQQVPTATFAINVQVTTGEEPAATPAPRKKR